MLPVLPLLPLLPVLPLRPRHEIIDTAGFQMSPMFIEDFEPRIRVDSSIQVLTRCRVAANNHVAAAAAAAAAAALISRHN